MIRIFTIYYGGDFWMALQKSNDCPRVVSFHSADSHVTSSDATRVIEGTLEAVNKKRPYSEHMLELKPMLACSRMRVVVSGKNLQATHQGKTRSFEFKSELLRYVLLHDPNVLIRYVNSGRPKKK